MVNNMFTGFNGSFLSDRLDDCSLVMKSIVDSLDCNSYSAVRESSTKKADFSERHKEIRKIIKPAMKNLFQKKDVELNDENFMQAVALAFPNIDGRKKYYKISNAIKGCKTFDEYFKTLESFDFEKLERKFGLVECAETINLKPAVNDSDVVKEVVSTILENDGVKEIIKSLNSFKIPTVDDSKETEDLKKEIEALKKTLNSNSNQTTQDTAKDKEIEDLKKQISDLKKIQNEAAAKDYEIEDLKKEIETLKNNQTATTDPSSNDSDDDWDNEPYFVDHLNDYENLIECCKEHIAKIKSLIKTVNSKIRKETDPSEKTKLEESKKKYEESIVKAEAEINRYSSIMKLMTTLDIYEDGSSFKEGILKNVVEGIISDHGFKTKKMSLTSKVNMLMKDLEITDAEFHDAVMHKLNPSAYWAAKNAVVNN